MERSIEFMDAATTYYDRITTGAAAFIGALRDPSRRPTERREAIRAAVLAIRSGANNYNDTETLYKLGGDIDTLVDEIMETFH